MCSRSPPPKRTRRRARVISATSSSRSHAPEHKPGPLVTRLNRKCNSWWYTAYYTCWVTTMRKQRKKHACGKLRQKFWNRLGWERFKSARSNVQYLRRVVRRESMIFKAFILSRIAAFGHAFRGWGYVLKTQQNAWIHSVFATVVIIVCLWLGIPPTQWAIIILTIAMVFTAEFINTAIEAVVDLASPVHHPLAKVGKDVGAGAVLVAALAAALVGLLILGPPLWARIASLFTGNI